MITASEVIPIAKIAQYLAADDQQNQTLLKSRFLRGNLSRDIYITRKSIEWLNAVNPSSSNLAQQVNYLYWKCMPYVGQARYILNQGGGGQIINPATGVASTIQEVFYQGFVDGSGSLTLVNGQTSFVIADDFIINNSLQVTVDTQVITYGVFTDRLSYTIDYTDTDATVNIFNGGLVPPANIGLVTDMMVAVRGQKFVTI